ncbi:MAG: NADH-quinone oxidoreductase subunit N [Gemmatimonadota bacterium]|nr:NADH-quinone oxidoreductase subunit N [Gemmatimonadota bacterium]
MTLDFSRQLHYVWALMPEIVLSIWGIGVLLAGARPPRGDVATDDEWLGWMSLIGVALAAAANGWLHGVTEVGTSAMVATDGVRLFANWVILLALALGILTSLDYVSRQRLQAAEFYGLMLFSAVGMMTMAGTRDLMLMFIGLEVMSIAIYVLAAFNRRDRRSAEAGLKYFLLGAFSSGFFLYGVALVYGAVGSTNLEVVGASLAAGTANRGLLTLGAVMLAVGFGFKVSLVPFHMWTPDVYEGSPTPVTAFMSAAVKATAFIAFLRVFTTAFGGMAETWHSVLWWLAALTMVGANLMALAQSNVKRMLAYSSVAHAGYLLVAIVALNETAAAALLFYVFVYTVMNLGAFAVVIAVSHHGEERLRIEDYAGFGWQQPALAVFLTVFLLSLAGFPGTGGFMAKVYLLLGARDAELWTLAVLLVLTTIASYWYYLRLAWTMWMREGRSPDTHRSVFAPLSMRFALAAAVILILLSGLFPGAALEVAGRSVAQWGAQAFPVPGLGQ